MISLKLRLVFLVLLAGALLGCSSTQGEPEQEERDPHTYLQLSVKTTELPSAKSRAEGVGFEAGSDNELIKTMRFIVLDNEGKVEHNIMIYNTSPASSAQTGAYIVQPEQLKQIFLVGNEESLPDDVRQMLRSLKYKDKLTDALVHYVIERKADAVSYTADQPIPMTEFFNFRVDTARYDINQKPVPYSADLFVTRIATKFTFNLTLDQVYSQEKFLHIVPGALTITPIATRQFLFPHDVVYDPAKPDPVVEGQQLTAADLQREIKKYEVPTTAPGSAPAPYSVTEWKKLDNTADGCRQYTTGSFYLMESAIPAEGEGYAVTLGIDGVTLTSNPLYLPDLPALPRNTHVIVNMTLSAVGLTAEVVVVPYIGIQLKPTFGFDQIKKKEP